MSFKAYEEYKDSGVEWLGEVPAHWQVVKLSYISSSKGGGTPPKDNLEYWNGGISWVTPKDMRRQIITKTMDTITPKAIDASSVQMIPPGHTLIVFRSGILRHTIPVAINRNAVTINQDMRAYNLAPYVSSNFFLRLVQGLNRELIFEWSKQGATVESLDSELVDSTKIPMPSKKEQTTIAAFLDHETARIDALIDEQQRLIALLKEKRQAVISHAVTKGLDPNVPMKDSGVEWLGEVPAHWGVGSLRWYATIQGGVAKGKDYDDATPVVELPYLRVANVQDGHVDLSEVKEINIAIKEVNRYLLQPKDVLMNEGGDNDKLGRGTVWEGEIEKCLHQNHVFSIRTNEALSPYWLAEFTRSSSARSYFYLHSKQSTNLASISSSNVMSCPIPLPSYSEQEKILRFIKAECNRLDVLASTGLQSISFLQERRSALISAAVTGKIDVRDWQPPEASQTAAKPAEASA
ncbi:restriction endonuclease subunit S [Cobetia sp. 1CM21F]|uniref:restriction endonuclease subunit S n=1 Tax=Cobetia sp. 1CM21F TaxID=2929163 RepID=UPI0020C05C2F|nr:restriction endonuclease subunit S [Cobetia sp. 1CM21F]MCK8067861.1 restriction endonuclease subunit S [Cobetia sp. 1CM21F]